MAYATVTLKKLNWGAVKRGGKTGEMLKLVDVKLTALNSHRSQDLTSSHLRLGKYRLENSATKVSCSERRFNIPYGGRKPNLSASGFRENQNMLCSSQTTNRVITIDLTQSWVGALFAGK